ncbi:DsbA family protein [Streptomyces sp. NPDC088785]|uniref:DsbA family protein n=1 Tax=Streptomyces sp. NPDC088785 TaxID=3365897 RepID=UPI00381A84D8
MRVDAGRAGRAAVMAALMVATAVLATGCGGPTRAVDEDSGKDSGKDGAARYSSVAELPEHLADDGTTILVGAPGAATTVHVYEDLRCPVCEDYEERGGGEALRDLVLSGQVAAHYTLASFLDDRLGGSGSLRAANALRAALEQDRFIEFHDVLFAHQPEEAVDGYTDAFLLRMASKVKGLRGEQFDTAVRTMKYRAFVKASQRAYERDGAPGTPTFAVNDTVVPDRLRGGMFDEAQLPVVVAVMVNGMAAAGGA